MKKTFLVLLAFLVAIRIITWEHTANLQLHSMYEFDTSRIRAREGIREDVPFTFFIQTALHDNMERHLLNLYDLELPEEFLTSFDDGSVTIIISFGREIMELTYRHSWYPRIFKNRTATVTFYEEYQSDTMFIYLMEQVYRMTPNFYVMNGPSREFWGYGRVGAVFAEELGNMW